MSERKERADYTREIQAPSSLSRSHNLREENIYSVSREQIKILPVHT